MLKAGKATDVPNTRVKGGALPFLLLKATAAQIPLRTSSADLVIATPPYVGERRTRPLLLLPMSANGEPARGNTVRVTGKSSSALWRNG
jgi:hypothetical protein